MRLLLHAPIPRALTGYMVAMAMLALTMNSAAAPVHGHAIVQGPPSATAADDEAAVVRAFESRIHDYVTLHRLLEGPLPPLQVSNDMNTVRAAMEALAKRIVAARPDARQGDLITPDVARVFRRRIAACLTPEEIEAVLTEGEPGERMVTPPRLTVDMRWPEHVPFNFVPPQLIATLPALPPELQYRIIGRALVLWDHHANLIVDFLPAAFVT
jgi:hypothetical protein